MSLPPVNLAVASLVLLLLGGGAQAAVRTTGPTSSAIEARPCIQELPDLAALPAGGFVTVWKDGTEIRGRLLDRDGLPQGGEIKVGGGESLWSPQVAADVRGNFLVAWSAGVLYGRVFSPAGAPLGPGFYIPQATTMRFSLVAERAGGFSILWSDAQGLWRQRYTAEGQSREPAQLTPLSPVSLQGAAAYGSQGIVAVWMEPGNHLRGGILQPGADPILFSVHTYTEQTFQALLFPPFAPISAVASHPDGSFLVAWRDLQGRPFYLSPQSAYVRVFDSTGRPAGERIRIDDGTGLFSSEIPGIDATAMADSFLVAWPEHAQAQDIAPGYPALRVRSLGLDGAPLGPPVLQPVYDPAFPALATGPKGRSLLVWQNGQYRPPAYTPISHCFTYGIFARPLLATCSEGGRLCLQGGRFQVQVARTNPDGSSGETHAADLTEETGTFWFFGPDNVELAVKILDGRTYNGHFWVFYGSLSDTGYTITVTDTVTGAVKAYVNPPSTLASRSDTAAFPAPPASSVAGGASPAQATAASHLPPRGGAGPCTDPTLPITIRPGLCLNQERFEVEVAWHDPFNGTSGIGTGVPLTEDSGYFWFFGPDNLELVVKVLDGRTYNGKYWVFYGALTNVEYTIRVYHPASRTERIYHNPPFQFRSHSDIDAFALP